jgi:hypothetical protein
MAPFPCRMPGQARSPSIFTQSTLLFRLTQPLGAAVSELFSQHESGVSQAEMKASRRLSPDSTQPYTGQARSPAFATLLLAVP